MTPMQTGFALAVGTLATAVGALGLAAVLLLSEAAPPALAYAENEALVAVPATGPATVVAGSMATVVAGPFPETTGEATAIVTGTYSTWTQQVLVVRGQARVDVPAEQTTRSGVLTVTVVGAGGRAATAVDVRAREVVEPVTPLVGARAIQADGEHWAMIVTIPVDEYGNPAAEGTDVTLRALHPDGDEERFDLQIEGALAWTRVFSNTLAGRTRIAAAVGDVRGPEADLLEVPGPPVDLPLERDEQPLVADGRSLLTVRTSTMVDAFANVVADGTEVRFSVRDADGTRTQTAPAVNGVAEVVIEAPTVAGEVTVTATAADATGQPLVLTYAAPADGRFDVTARHEDDQVLIEVGPVLGDLGQYLPDGTEVTIRVRTDRRTVTHEAALDAGRLVTAVWIGPDVPATVTVLVAGTIRTVEVGR